VLNPEAPSPLYRQLAEELAARIRSGKLGVGQRIPSEQELVQLHGIGRPTVRQATDFLVRQGLLERRRGSGTYVLPARAEVDLFTLGGTIAAFEGAGVVLSTAFVEPLRNVECVSAEAGPIASRVAYVFGRLGHVGDRPVLFERTFLDAAVFPGLNARWLEQEPLSRLVQHRYRQRPVSGRQTIRAFSLEAREARLLKVTKGESALLIERTLDFPGAKSALFTRIFALTDRVLLTQSLTEPLAPANVEREDPGLELERRRTRAGRKGKITRESAVARQTTRKDEA
jgi:GntR family transcriptional regulator